MTAEIKLTRGQVTLIDDQDADLADLKWYAMFAPAYGNGGMFFAGRSVQDNGKAHTRYLHRLILARVLGRELSRKEQADHINGNPLDNRRDNLRLATSSQNNANKGLRKDNTSGFKGVHFEKHIGKYRAQIKHAGVLRRLGSFDTPEEAHGAYCTAAREIWGEFANFGTHKDKEQGI